MASNMNTKIRLVRCPRCRLLLPELAEVPVYKCGGCGTVLQAKTRKNDINNAASGVLQTESTPEPTPDQASEDRETISVQQSTIVSNKVPDTNHCEEPRSSTDLSSHENPESSPEARTHIESDVETCLPDEDNRMDQIEFIDSEKEKNGDANLYDDVFSSLEINVHHEDKSSSVQREVDGSMCSLDEENGEDRSELEDSSRELLAEPSSHEIEESTEAAGTVAKVDEKLKNGSTFRSLVAEKLLDTKPRKLVSISQRPLDEDMQQSHNTSQGFEQAKSLKVVENYPVNNQRSDISVAPGDISKSPTIRSYNAYDASVSSFDENDDQIKDTDLIPRRRNYNVSSKIPKRGDNIKMGKNLHPTNEGKWPLEYLGTTRHGYPARDMMASEVDDARSRVPFYTRGLRATHGDASASSLGFSEFQYKQMHLSPAKHDDLELEKLELLRMVHQLQAQLNIRNIMMGEANKRFPSRVAMKEKHISSYNDHLADERELHHDPNDPRYPGRYDQEKICSHQCNPPRMAFSGEAGHSRNQVDYSCFHCYSQERYYSAQLPRRDIYCNAAHYGIHPSHYNPYQLGTPSPQHHPGSEFSLWSHETMSNDQRLRKDRDMKNCQPPKRHFRSVANGSPLIACYQCSKILQVPADFLLFRRRYHSLKCSACSKLLKFSLQNRSRLIPYVPEGEAIAPPPSEIDEYSDTNKARTLGTVSHTSYGRHAVSMSYSDDFGGSFSKDYSTETDPSGVAAPFDRKMSSTSSSNPMENRKNSVLHNSKNRYKKRVQTSVPARPSAKKISSEIEEIEETPGRSGSPLHRLMGYASPSKVMCG